MWVRRASDREEMSRNLQEFLPKTELMRAHAEHTAIALNPPFSRVRTAAREAAGANHRARSGGQRGPPGGGGGPLLRAAQWDGLLSKAGTL